MIKPSIYTLQITKDFLRANYCIVNTSNFRVNIYILSVYKYAIEIGGYEDKYIQNIVCCCVLFYIGSAVESKWILKI